MAPSSLLARVDGDDTLTKVPGIPALQSHNAKMTLVKCFREVNF